MVWLGTWLVVLGFGSLLLPLVGLEIRLMTLLDPAQPWAGIVMGAFGALLVVGGVVFRRNGTGEQ